MDGNRAVEMGMSGEYGLAILDVHMPAYDGVEVVRMLRRRHVLHPMKIIAITGDTSSETRKRLEEAGADAFMDKPVDLDALLERVTALVGPAGKESSSRRR